MPAESPQKQSVKHVACTRCRERKVKCDGVKPNCARCRRIRHPCQYVVSGKKQPPQAKSEWIRHLRTFSAQIGDQGYLPYASAPRPLQSAANNSHAAAFTPVAPPLRGDNAVNIQRTTWDSQGVSVQSKVAHSASHFLPSPTVVFQDGLAHPETPCSLYSDGAFPCPTSHMYGDQPTPASTFFLPTLDRSETPTSQASCETWSDQFFESYLPVIDTSFDMSITVDTFDGGRHNAGSFCDSNFATY